MQLEIIAAPLKGKQRTISLAQNRAARRCFNRPRAVVFTFEMKLPDIYTDWRIVAGLALMILGAGNWIIGFHRTQQYSEMIAASAHSATGNDYRSFDELDAGTGVAVLEPLTSERRKVSYATARMDFYHATFITGQVMVVIGLMVSLWGFIAVIQSDTRNALRRAALGPPPEGRR
jgi:hypothetical protein